MTNVNRVLFVVLLTMFCFGTSLYDFKNNGDEVVLFSGVCLFVMVFFFIFKFYGISNRICENKKHFNQ